MAVTGSEQRMANSKKSLAFFPDIARRRAMDNPLAAPQYG